MEPFSSWPSKANASVAVTPIILVLHIFQLIILINLILDNVLEVGWLKNSPFELFPLNIGEIEAGSYQIPIFFQKIERSCHSWSCYIESYCMNDHSDELWFFYTKIAGILLNTKIAGILLITKIAGILLNTKIVGILLTFKIAGILLTS